MTSIKLPLIAFTTLAMLGLGACATSAPTTPSAAVAPVVAKAEPTAQMADADDAGEQICKRQAIVGSKFKRKICGTKEHWENVETRARQSARNVQDSPRGSTAN